MLQFDIIVGDRKVADWGDGTKNRAFGELALLYNLPRAATVKSQAASRLWFIDRLTFRHIIARASQAQNTRLRNALRKGILEDLSEPQLEALTAAATIVKYNQGDSIIKKGEDGEVFFIIESGSVICKNLGGDQSNNILTAGDYFGERALLRKGDKRAADVEALTDVSLIALHREDFEAHLGHLKDLLEYNIGMRLLLCTPLIGALTEEARQELFAALSVASYADGAVIAAQGRKCDSFFLLKDASVVVRHMTVQPAGSAAAASNNNGGLSTPRLKSARDVKEGFTADGAPATPVPGSGLKPSGGSFLTRSLSRMNILGAARDPSASVGNDAEAATGVSASAVQAAIVGAGSPAHSGSQSARLSSTGSKLDLGASALDRNGSFSARSASSSGTASGGSGTNGDGSVYINNDLGILEPGHWFPDRELDTDAPLPASFVAKGETQVFVLEKEAYLKLIAPVKAKLLAEGRLRSPTATMLATLGGNTGSGSGFYGSGPAGLASQPSMSRLGSSRTLNPTGSFIGAPSPVSSARSTAGTGLGGLGPISEDKPQGGASSSSSSGAAASSQVPPLSKQPTAKPGALSSQPSSSQLTLATPSSTSAATPSGGSTTQAGALAGLPVKPSTPIARENNNAAASKETGAAKDGASKRSSLLEKDGPAAGAATPVRESKEVATPQRPDAGREAKEAEEKDYQRGGRSSGVSSAAASQLPPSSSNLSSSSSSGAGAMPQQPQPQVAKPPSGSSSSSMAPVPVVASRPKEARRFSTEHKAPGAVAPPSGSGGSAAPSPAPLALPPATRKRLAIPIKELDLKQTLGTGTFGRVRLAFHKKTGQVYALKMLQKQQIAALKQQKNIQNERDILWRVDHPFIIRLYDTYKDRDRLYMLLEIVQGGELFGRLQHSPTPGRIRPDEARFYAACVLDAFDYLHSLHVVYRDLKPENLLIDSQGYLKLVDFGFAKFVTDKTFTLW
jgi:CRP-like cAMP-binding protein